jgi:hypothetical protein
VRQVEHSRRTARNRWLAPAARAAAAVASIAAAVAACGAVQSGQTSPTRSHQMAASATPVQTNVPPYYVALIGSKAEYQDPGGYPPADAAVVRATTTGAALARIKPPRPYTFAAVTGAADDRTFVLFGVGPLRKTNGPGMYYGNYSQRFFLLRINPVASSPSARTSLTALPPADIASGEQVLAMALSPDGKSLAAILSRPTAASPADRGYLSVFDLASGTQQTWTRNVCYYGKCVQAPIGDWPPIVGGPSRIQLSWTSGGRSLLFIAGPTGSQVRLLDVGAPGRDLTADSYPLPIRGGSILWQDAVITPDGKTVFIERNSGAATLISNLSRFSAATGSTTVVNQVVTFTEGHPTGAGPDDVLWTNDNGSKIVVLGAHRGPKTGGLKGDVFSPAASGQTAGVYTGTRYTPLPWPANVVDAAW